MSLMAAIMWGLSYAVSERLMQNGIGSALILLSIGLVTLPLYSFIAASKGEIRAGLAVFSEKPLMLFLTVVMALGIVVGNYLIMQSIALKNATYASLIEITYPLFTCFFAWLLFRDVQLNLYTAVGAVLIFTGIGVIFLKS
jgi:drug/metabolite transporter (DMT)-like permease